MGPRRDLIGCEYFLPVGSCLGEGHFVGQSSIRGKSRCMISHLCFLHTFTTEYWCRMPKFVKCVYIYPDVPSFFILIRRCPLDPDGLSYPGQGEDCG